MEQGHTQGHFRKSYRKHVGEVNRQVAGKVSLVMTLHMIQDSLGDVCNFVHYQPCVKKYIGINYVGLFTID